MFPSVALLLYAGIALLLVASPNSSKQIDPAVPTNGPVSSEQIKYINCSPNGELDCAISNAAITPCISIEKDACKIKRDTNATLTFDFIPHWTPGENQLKTIALWSYPTIKLGLPLFWLDTDACKYAACPLVKGQPNSYNSTFHFPKVFMRDLFNIEFKIWDDETEKECCLVFKLKVI